MTALFSRSWEILRTKGFRSLWFKVLGETIYRRMDVAEMKLRADSACSIASEGLEIGLLQAAEIDEFIAFRAFNDRSTVEERLAQGQLCVFVRKNGELIHSTWVAGGRVRIDYLDYEIQLSDDAAYVYEAYTSPAWRGRSVPSIRSPALNRYCLERGYTRRLAVVWPEDKSACRAMEKAGYFIVGRSGYFGAGRFKKHFLHYRGNDLPFRQIEKSGQADPDCGDRYWDKVPGNLDSQSHYLDPFLAQLKRRENLRLVREWGEVSATGHLLKTDAFEEAMGKDAFLADLQDEAGEITGIDISHTIVKRASENHKGDTPRFVAANVRQLPFKNAIFSTVVSPSTLDHFPDPSDLGVSLQELLRVMRPGGRLIITLDNRQNILDPLLSLVHKLGMIPYYMGRSYTVGELRNELECAGFAVKETTAILHNPRLVAVGSMKFVRWLGWQWLIRAMQKSLLAAQGLEKTRLCYYTGSFVAALAIRPESISCEDEPA